MRGAAVLAQECCSGNLGSMMEQTVTAIAGTPEGHSRGAERP